MQPAPLLGKAKALVGPQPQPAPRSDVELLHAIARGDEQAFASFYDSYSSILFGLLLRILNSRAEAEEVLQEVFLQIWQQAASYDEGRGRPFTWIVTLARSRAIDRLRAIDSRNRVSVAAMDGRQEFTRDVVDTAIKSEQREIVQRALAELPEKQRQTLLLAYFEGLSQSEIAARLGEPLGTVKTRSRAGLMKLRELLREKLLSLR